MLTDQRQCILVTAGCTTGWTDWIHGELWLCPNGLLRRSVGLGATLKHAVFRTVDPKMRPVADFAAADIARIVSDGRRNLWISWPEIEHADLQPVRLNLRMRDGSKVTFMWVPVDDVDPLRERLPIVLGDRIRAS
jgi:hypothetical protein